MTQTKTESNFLSKSGQYLGYFISLIWVILIAASVYKLKDGSLPNSYWVAPILLAVSTIASNAYYFSKIKEKDTKKKETANLIYFHTTLIPIYLTVFAFLVFILKDAPFGTLLLIR